MTGGRALILAGTGMLAEVAEALARDGWHVVLPSRRYSPIAVPEAKQARTTLRVLRPPGHRPHRNGNGNGSGGDSGGDSGNAKDGQGRAIWVEARWDRPRELARKAEAVLGGPADLLVVWVHGQYRRSVMGAVERLLAADACVVEVRAAASSGPPVEPEPVLAAHRTQQVLLGMVSEYDSTRSLAHGEIADGVLAAVRRALEGHPASLHQIGHPRPMVR